MTKDSQARDLTSDDFAILRRPYLLVISIPIYRDESGTLWLERAWRQDLIQHLSYISDLRLCAPVLPKEGQPDLVRIDLPPGVRMRVLPLPAQLSRLGALRALPRTVSVLWRAIGDAEIVHSGVIGWPYPLGWIANPLTVLRRRSLLIVVESSWLRGGPGRKDRRLAFWDTVSHWMARWSCKHADLAFFTQPTYRDTLHSGDRDRAYVTPAVWINDADILDEATARSIWNRKLSEPVRLLLAGRLTAGKGIDVLLAALRLLDGRGVRARVDIIGAGDRRPACILAAKELGTVQLSVLDPVPYGRQFFELLQQYHAMLIPNLTDEQPRILFDAGARAVPAIASDTPGLRPYVDQDITGWLTPSGDPKALALMIERAMGDASKLRTMGLEALSATRGLSHLEMHRTRSQILAKHFPSPAA
jgi:glycosyltransferase involved in cell wall biosynthesis